MHFTVYDKILSLMIKRDPADVQLSMIWKWCVYFETVLIQQRKKFFISIAIKLIVQ